MLGIRKLRSLMTHDPSLKLVRQCIDINDDIRDPCKAVLKKQRLDGMKENLRNNLFWIDKFSEN